MGKMPPEGEKMRYPAMNSTEGYPAPRAIAAAIGRCGDAGYRHSVEILPTVRRCKQRSIAQLAMKPRGKSAAAAIGNAPDGKIQQPALQPKTPSSAMEEGVCVLCGSQKRGHPAMKDFAISAARKLRKILGGQGPHTIACKNCIGTCLQKREAFEKEARLGMALAAAFFFIVAAGGTYFKQFELWIFAPAILGAAIILLLPYGRYYPKFARN